MIYQIGSFHFFLQTLTHVGLQRYKHKKFCYHHIGSWGCLLFFIQSLFSLLSDWIISIYLTSKALILSSVIAVLLWAIFFLRLWYFSVPKFPFDFSLYHRFLYWDFFFLFFHLFPVCNCFTGTLFYSFFKILVR